MKSRLYVYLALFLGIIIISIISLGFFLNSAPSTTTLAQLQPNVKTISDKINNIVIFNGTGFNKGLGVTLRNLQAIINDQHPNGTILYIITQNQDITILQQVYSKLSSINFYQFNNTGDHFIDLKNLLECFKFLIKGYVLFNESERILYPGVLNFVSTYTSTIAIPDNYRSLLPTNYNYLEMYDFTNASDISNITSIDEFYQSQVTAIGNNLKGVNLWNYEIGQTFYFDFVVFQKYYTFPIELLNGSFPSIAETIKTLADQSSNKAILNQWPEEIPRLSLPLYKNIDGISNLSFLSKPFSFTNPITNTLQDLFATKIDQPRNEKQTGNEFNYSLLINEENSSAEFVYNVMISVLTNTPNFFDYCTIVLDDSLIVLMPEIIYWIFSNHPNIYFIPRIQISTIIQAVYFPIFFSNQVAFVQQSQYNLTRNDWDTSEYKSLFQNHFIGCIGNDISKTVDFCNTPIKSLSLSYYIQNGVTRNLLIKDISDLLTGSIDKPFSLLFSGNYQFLILSIFAFHSALQYLEQKLNFVFQGQNLNSLFNKL